MMGREQLEEPEEMIFQIPALSKKLTNTCEIQFLNHFNLPTQLNNK